MAKLALFLVAIVALQGCYGASLPRRELNELEEVVQDFADAMKQVNGYISLIAGHLSSVAREYDHQIGVILEKHPLYPVIAELRETVSKLESESSDEAQKCFSTAWTEVAVITEGVKRGMDNCLSEAHTVGGQIHEILLTLNGKATKIQAELAAGFNKCKNDVKCLREVIEPLKKELTNFKKDIDRDHEVVHTAVEDGTRHLNICLQRLREESALKSRNVIENLKDCVKDNAASSRGILEFFQELKEKIDHIIDLVSNFPSSIQEIPDKINEIISHINISVIYTQLKNQIHEFIEEGGENAEKCLPEADQRLEEIIHTAEVESKACMSETESKVDKIEAEFKDLTDKAVQLLSDVNQIILDCLIDNKLNPAGFAKCLTAKSDDFKQRVTEIENDVEQTIEKAEEQAKELLQSFASCANKMQLDTINKGQSLIVDVQKCVSNANDLY